MRFDPKRFSQNLQAWEERNRNDSDMFLLFHLIDLVSRDVAIQDVDFDSFSVDDIETLMDRIAEYEEYYSKSKINPEVNLFNPVHEYTARYELFTTLRNPEFRVYSTDDNFI